MKVKKHKKRLTWQEYYTANAMELTKMSLLMASLTVLAIIIGTSTKSLILMSLGVIIYEHVRVMYSGVAIHIKEMNINNQSKPIKFKDIFLVFRGDSTKILMANLIRRVLVFISLLFFVLPGIYVSFRLSEIEFVMADDSRISIFESFKLSWLSTKGKASITMKEHLKYNKLHILLFLVSATLFVSYGYMRTQGIGYHKTSTSFSATNEYMVLQMFTLLFIAVTFLSHYVQKTKMLVFRLYRNRNKL